MTADTMVPESSPLRSQTTSSVPEILARIGRSLLVSTYQAGFVVVLRASNPQELNTHFRRFQRPMGMAHHAGRLAIGTDRDVVEFWNMPAVCSRLPSLPASDACFIPRKNHITGHIDIHELAWGREGLWFVNTLFSCLCTLDSEHSFVPRWWPKFITGLGPEDRCHLNGLALRDGQPAFVTCHSISDAPQGWRAHKKDGGVLIDVPSGEIVRQGLSMPHSPRWHNDRLWLLESGDGSLGFVDLPTGRYEPVCKFDGFTRGLSFSGEFAFVGLSQVRESAIFSGIPIAARLQDKERLCGLGVVHLPTGRQVGWVHFEDAVQEVFAVEAVPHQYPDLLEPGDPLIASSYSLPDDALRHVVRRATASGGDERTV